MVHNKEQAISQLTSRIQTQFRIKETETQNALDKLKTTKREFTVLQKEAQLTDVERMQDLEDKLSSQRTLNDQLAKDLKFLQL